MVFGAVQFFYRMSLGEVCNVRLIRLELYSVIDSLSEFIELY